MGIYFEKALSEMPNEYRHFWLKDAGSINPEFDVYLRIDDGDYRHDLPPELSPSIFWVSDTHLAGPFKSIAAQARHYNYVFCAMKEGVEAFKRKGIAAKWSAAACDPDIHKILDMPKKFDIGYVGNDGGIPRKFYLQQIRERYPNSFLGTAPYTKMSEIYSASRIGFNFIRPAESVTMRCMEIMSCGAMLLVNRIADGSFEDLGFEDTENVVFYDNPRHLFDLMDYYLNNDNQRQGIARAGRQLALAKHTYRCRLEEMLAYL